MEINKSPGSFLDDKQSLLAIVAQLEPRLQREYNQMRALSLESAFPNRRMIIYTLRNCKPDNVSMLLFGGIEMARSGGPKVTVTDDLGSVSIGIMPQRWRNREIFLHVPQQFIFKWKGKDVGAKEVEFVPHYAILYKTRSKEHLQVEGDTYAATLNNFRTRFPQIPVEY